MELEKSWASVMHQKHTDFMTSLNQDSRLPEDSIHDLARDLLKALQFLHSKEIIYSDLKPSNILLDENGRAKVVASTVPGLLESITGEVQQMMGGRRHGHLSSPAGRTTRKTITHLFPVILHLLGSMSFKRRVVSLQVVQQLANLIKLVELPFRGRYDFQITLLRILESVTEESSVIVENPYIFITQVLPSVTVLYKGNKDGDARFLCLRLLFDVMVIFLIEPSEDERRAEGLKSISNIHFLPLYPTLIEDEDPIPMYAPETPSDAH